jgi:cobaltochelatase CobN
MHVLFRESHGLEETALPRDLGQAPAPLSCCRFPTATWPLPPGGIWRARAIRPFRRYAWPTAALEHPLSVDTYVEQTLDAAGEGARRS